MLETLESVDLELLLNRDAPARCTAVITPHECTTIARWIVYCKPECGRLRNRTVLWCDARHALWVHRVAAGDRCRCGLPAEHLQVMPL